MELFGRKDLIKTILVVAAHPDDDILGCGGSIASHVENGDKVFILFMSNGVDSRKDIQNHDFEKRKSAAISSSKVLGAQTPIFFDFPDNRMDSVDLLDIVQPLEKLIEKIKPEVVYTHHIGDLNIDHQITHKAVVTACRPQPGFCVKEIFAFEVLSSTEWQTSEYLPFIPNVYFDISNQIEKKCKALKFYDNEMRQSPHSRSIDNTIRLNALRGNSVGVDYAEAFILIRSLKKIVKIT
jgi:N-acetylglucosamine malate deacetylase 1